MFTFIYSAEMAPQKLVISLCHFMNTLIGCHQDRWYGDMHHMNCGLLLAYLPVCCSFSQEVGNTKAIAEHPFTEP